MSDRDVVNEALRLASGTRLRHDWHIVWSTPTEQSFFDALGHEFNVTYSEAGRITHLVHWVPIGPTPCSLASRTPIERRKRAYLLKEIAGE